MLRRQRKLAGRLILMLFIITSLSFENLMAEDHVVNSSELHNAIVAASQKRAADLDKVKSFLTSKTAVRSLQKAQVDLVKVEKALPLLGDEELDRLASRVDKVQSDLAAGALTNQEITYILIALATAVVILVIVAA